MITFDEEKFYNRLIDFIVIAFFCGITAFFLVELHLIRVALENLSAGQYVHIIWHFNFFASLINVFCCLNCFIT